MKGAQDCAMIGAFWFFSLDTYSAILADTEYNAVLHSIPLKSVGLLAQYTIDITGRSKVKNDFTA